jgi:hypothetical protein
MGKPDPPQAVNGVSETGNHAILWLCKHRTRCLVSVHLEIIALATSWPSCVNPAARVFASRPPTGLWAWLSQAWKG